MVGDLVEILDAVDRTVAAAEGVVPDAAAARAAERAADLRRRRGFLGRNLVVGIAGGTGTGKSSLLNAMAGEPVASVSPVRPHTEKPLAWLPAGRGPALDDLLDRLGVSDRILQTRRPGLALIDLPDMDSVAARHRRIVEGLLPKVDAVIWVFDPSKYGDPALHSGFLRPLAGYRDQFVFVLNKIDTVDADARNMLGREVRDRLHDDGYPEPQLFLVAAAPSSGEPEGIHQLESYVAEQLDAKRLAVSKWLIDIDRELRGLGEEAGVWKGGSVRLEQRWERDRDAAIAGIVPGRGPAGRFDAVCRLEDLIAMVAVEAGAPTGRAIESRFPEGAIEAALDEAEREAARAAAGVPRRRVAGAATAAARRILDRRIGRPLREALEHRARFGATLVEAALKLAAVRSQLASVAGPGPPGQSASVRAEAPAGRG